jgi:DNA-binding PadR family transcriptional regulator
MKRKLDEATILAILRTLEAAGDIHSYMREDGQIYYRATEKGMRRRDGVVPDEPALH